MVKKRTDNPAAGQQRAEPLAAVPDGTKSNAPQTLGEAMLRVMAAIPYVRKRGSMKTYKFVRDTDVIAALRGPMIENGLMLTGPHKIRNRKHEPKTTSGGATMNFAHAEYMFCIEFVPTKESRPVWVVGEGADSLDKASNKSMSAARKYALILAFNLTSGDDPDQFDEEGRYGGGEHEDEQQEPQQPDHGNNQKKANPPKPEPAKPAADKPAKPAKVLPENGEELLTRLKDYEARLVASKACNAGELLSHVKALGVEAGYTDNLAEWSGAAIEFAVEATKKFDPKAIQAERERVRAAEQAAIAANEAATKATQPAPQAAAQAAPQNAGGSNPATPTPLERYSARIERMNATKTKANLDKFRELYTKDADMSAEQKKALEACYWDNLKRIEAKK